MKVICIMVQSLRCLGATGAHQMGRREGRRNIVRANHPPARLGTVRHVMNTNKTQINTPWPIAHCQAKLHKPSLELRSSLILCRMRRRPPVGLKPNLRSRSCNCLDRRCSSWSKRDAVCLRRISKKQNRMIERCADEFLSPPIPFQATGGKP